MKRSVCSLCGTEEDEWIKVDEDGTVKPILPQPYVHDFKRCHGCDLLGKARDDIPASARGVYVQLINNPELTDDGCL